MKICVKCKNCVSKSEKTENGIPNKNYPRIKNAYKYCYRKYTDMVLGCIYTLDAYCKDERTSGECGIKGKYWRGK